MKKYSRSSIGKKAGRQSFAGAQGKTDGLADSKTHGSGDGHQLEEKGKTCLRANQSLCETSEVNPNLNTKPLQGGDDDAAEKATIGSPSHDASVLQSTSDSDNTQYDLANLDAGENGQLSMPLNCVWGNGMQFQPSATYDLSNSVMQLPVQPPNNMPLTTAMIHVPNCNTSLPFPDGSGNMNSFPSPLQSTMLQPPAPTLNASLGFPSVYVSPAGLITVLLKYDVAVEMTVDKNIRVVNHRHKAVAATNNRGSSNCVYHVTAKVFHDGTRTEVEVFGERRARMQTNGILFASSMETYLLDDCHIVPSQFVFNDMSKDSSVNILFTAGMVFTNELLVHCDEITKSSRYYFHKDGSTTIIINNIKIHQDEHGEVEVISGPRYISTSPVYGSVYLQTHFVEISVQVRIAPLYSILMTLYALVPIFYHIMQFKRNNLKNLY